MCLAGVADPNTRFHSITQKTARSYQIFRYALFAISYAKIVQRCLEYTGRGCRPSADALLSELWPVPNYGLASQFVSA